MKALNLFIILLLVFGRTSAQYSKDMLTPIEQLAHATVRIESQTPSGLSTGTGFFYAFARRGDQMVPAIVTNKHVVSGAKRGKFIMTLAKQDGSPDIGNVFGFEITDFDKAWISHPDDSVDLAVMPIAPLLREAEKQNKRFFYVPLDANLLMTPGEIDDMIGLDSVAMVGYPNGLWDQRNNLPIFRRGVLASDYKRDWNGRPEFLIDAACYPGSSGSPVLLCDLNGYPSKKGFMMGTTRIKLIGILYAGPQFSAVGSIVIQTIPTVNTPVSVTNIPNNLGIVIKAKALDAFESLLSR